MLLLVLSWQPEPKRKQDGEKEIETHIKAEKDNKVRHRVKKKVAGRNGRAGQFRKNPRGRSPSVSKKQAFGEELEHVLT